MKMIAGAMVQAISRRVFPWVKWAFFRLALDSALTVGFTAWRVGFHPDLGSAGAEPSRRTWLVRFCLRHGLTRHLLKLAARSLAKLLRREFRFLHVHRLGHRGTRLEHM